MSYETGNGSQAAPDIERLLAALSSSKGLERQKAREALVEIGRPAVPGLIKALASPNKDERWSAAKALTEIHDPSAAPALVTALQDREYGVRWLAGEALIELGREALIPVLKALIEHADSVWLRESAHHVLSGIARREDLSGILDPVLAAIKSSSAPEATPVAAGEALKTLYGL